MPERVQDKIAHLFFHQKEGLRNEIVNNTSMHQQIINNQWLPNTGTHY